MTDRLVLVTGAGGALGRHLVPALRDAGWRVRALVRRRSVAAANEAVAGDLLEPASLRAAVAGADAVLHGAAVTHARNPRRYHEVNVNGTRALVEAARAAGVGRFLLLSSGALGEGGGAYSDSKRAAEEVVAAAGIPFTVVRLPEVYGAGGREGIDRLIADCRAGRQLVIVGDGRDEVSPVHVDDAVAAIVRALDAPEARDKTYTLAAEPLSLREAAEACRAAFGSRSRIVRVPERAARLAARAARILPLPLYPDQLERLRAPRPAPSPEAASELGFRPRPFPEGLT